MGKYPVTNDQYLRSLAEHYRWPLKRLAVGVSGQEPPPGRGNHPVVGITWDDA